VDGTRACEELGLEIPGLKLVVVENTPQVHNAIVCTLCSCYPRVLLGIPPDWYKSRNYRSRMVREPRVVLEEFGLKIPENVAIRVHDSTADMLYLVLPMRPAGTEGWTAELLAALVIRDSMIGVSIPKG
jgi:nitrile hydratase